MLLINLEIISKTNLQCSEMENSFSGHHRASGWSSYNEEHKRRGPDNRKEGEDEDGGVDEGEWEEVEDGDKGASHDDDDDHDNHGVGGDGGDRRGEELSEGEEVFCSEDGLDGEPEQVQDG